MPAIRTIKSQSAALVREIKKLYPRVNFAIHHSPKGGFDVYAYIGTEPAFRDGRPIAHIEDIMTDDAFVSIWHQCHTNGGRAFHNPLELSVRCTNGEMKYHYLARLAPTWTRSADRFAAALIQDAANLNRCSTILGAVRESETSHHTYIDLFTIGAKL